MQQAKKNTSLVWFGNDLRVHDNAVLSSCINESKSVIAVYFLDPKLFEYTNYGFIKTGAFRVKFLLETLNDLKAQLLKINVTLLVYSKSPKHQIKTLVERYDIDTIYRQEEWTSEEQTTLGDVVESLHKSINIKTYKNQFLYHPEDAPFDVKATPSVFTQFRKLLEKQAQIRPIYSVTDMPDTNQVENTTRLPSMEDLGYDDLSLHPKTAFPFHGGETQGLQRLQDYFFKTKGLGVYKKTRNGLVGTNYSSKFSPWLANGSLSARMIYWEVKRFEKEQYSNNSTYWMIFELIWRDYFKYISLKHGNSIFYLNGILGKSYKWNSNPKAIQSWIDGRTADDFVNANMIELQTTGWMSNRGRQNVASYFSKTLLLDWRIGAAYFESQLLDYDVHSNYGNWMYVSGVGNDPRDRIFNVKTQAERYDPKRKFRNLWLQTKLF